jgi:hypothetical protein
MNNMDQLDQPDDLDRLFARLERAPAPPDLTARVLARTVRGEPRASVAWTWCLAGLLALVGVAVAGYLVGATLAASDGLDVLEAVAADLTLLTVAPGDVLAAVGEVVPWRLVGLAGCSAALLTWASGRALIPARRAEAR